MNTNPITSWRMMVAREFGATVIGLSNQSEQKLAALIEKHDPHAETVRLFKRAYELLVLKEEDWNQWDYETFNEIRAHLATLKGEKK